MHSAGTLNTLKASSTPDAVSAGGARASLRETVPTGGTPRSLGPFFTLASRAPGLTRMLGPLVTPIVPLLAPSLRRNTHLNAQRIFGHQLSPSQQRAFTRRVVSNFYTFITDMATASRRSADPALANDLIGDVYGEPRYRALRAPEPGSNQRRGAVLVTAHIGSFEAGLLALRQVEPAVHVVFKRDASAPFERMRTALRRSLGVHEAAIDDGMSTWMNLRDALLRGEVVVLQADRALPGQQSAAVPFLSGTLRMPTGPVRLARLTNSPIVPVFAIRRPDGKHDIHLGQPIEPGPSVAGQADAEFIAIAKAIEAIIAKHPDQWLMLDAAFEEDRSGQP